MSPTSPPAGYSGTPLPRKLGLKDGMAAVFIGLPDAVADLAEAVDFARLDRLDGWPTVLDHQAFDFIHAFTKSHADLVAGLPVLQDGLKRDGMIWVSWPKKASKVPTDVTEDVVRAEALKLDLVDVKVAAVDQVWSGLKLVIRKERR